MFFCLHHVRIAANLLLDHQGVVKLADFGIMAILDNEDALCKTFVGTTVYMSPERIRGEKVEM